MCYKCGQWFLVEYRPDGPFQVVKTTDSSRVYLDQFESELEAAQFAAQLHADRLRSRNFFKRFEECSTL